MPDYPVKDGTGATLLGATPRNRSHSVRNPATVGERADYSAGDYTFSQPVSAMHVEGDGNVAVKFDDWNGNTFTMSFAGGLTHSWGATKIYQTGTTATGVVGVIE